MSPLQNFYPYIKREKNLYILGFVGSIFRFIIPLLVPLVLKYIFDEILQNDEFSNKEKMESLLWITVSMIGIFILVRAPMEYVRQFCMHKANNNIIKQLRKDTFKKVHQLDMKYFADNKSGEIGTRFFDDIEKIRGFLTAACSNIWIEMIVLLFITLVMFTLNIALTLLAIFLVGLQFTIAHLLAKKFKQSTKDMMNYRSVLSGFVFEKIQGAFLSKLYSAEKHDKQELNEHLTKYEVLTDKHAKINGFMLSSVNVLSDMTPLVVVMVGSVFVIEGNITIGSLIAFFAYVDKMRSPVAALVQAIPTITEGSVALQRIFEFLHIPSSIVEKEEPVLLQEFSDSISFNKVNFSYHPGAQVIKDLHLQLKKGKTYAFVGESGGGKSTILQLMMRMYDVESGEVKIDGVNIKDYSLSSIRNQIGIVTQDNFLYSSSIKDNIKMAKLDATDEEIIEAAKKAYAHDFITKLPNGYETEIGERGIKLSGGQKQRISLARVFLKNPSIIILDEATSALDNESEILIQNSINEFGKNKTVIMIAHRLTTVIHSDTIFVLKNGSIIESGNHYQLLEENGYYKDLYSKQKNDKDKNKIQKVG